MKRAAALIAALVLVVAASLYFSGDLRAPWSGAALVITAAALLGLGAFAGLRGVLLAAITSAVVFLAWFPPWVDDTVENYPMTDCDPSCGISPLGALIILTPVVIAIASVGALLRAAARSRALRRLRTSN
jgi:hypothetical protein